MTNLLLTFANEFEKVSQMNPEREISQVLVFARLIQTYEIRENWYHKDMFSIKLTYLKDYFKTNNTSRYESNPRATI